MINQCEKVSSSTLYIVPTPIGNFGDITYRALSVLKSVDFIVAEDLRRTGVLLQYFSINKSVFILHKHNEIKKTKILLSQLQVGHSIALVSNSGTPLINDPGYQLVRSCCYCSEIRVVPLPGACAAITALSASGLPTNRFCYEGFLPRKRKSRLDCFKKLLTETRTMIFYDSKYRIVDSLRDIVTILGSERYIVLARELTKVWESIYRAPVGKLLSWIEEERIYIRGEIVLIIEGCCIIKKESLNPDIIRMIQFLMKELPFRTVLDLVVKMYGVNKNIVYSYLLTYNSSKKF